MNSIMVLTKSGWVHMSQKPPVRAPQQPLWKDAIRKEKL